MGGHHRPRSIDEFIGAIRRGDVEKLSELLAAQPGLIDVTTEGRTSLHEATHWPGNWPNVAETIRRLVAAGADVNAPCPHPTNALVRETPLHWAASSGDAAAVDALLDLGADINRLGGIFGGCPPYEEAIIFEHYAAARTLLRRGADSYLPGAAALGRMDLVKGYFDEDDNLRLDIGMLPHWKTPPPVQVLLDRSLQFACRAGHLEIARFLRDRGADPRSRTPADTSALDEATKNGHAEVIEWLSR